MNLFEITWKTKYGEYPRSRHIDARTEIGALMYDYDPCRHCLAIQMPSPLHDIFCAKIVDEISRQLRQFQRIDGPVADFAKEVEHFATSRILIPEDTGDGRQTYSRREPDASWLMSIF